jgi:hypothetical protein
MAGRRPRSGFWIVYTHVGTSGFAMPILFCLVASVIAGKLRDPAAFCVFWIAQLAGTIVGTLCSLSNLRKTVSYSRWTKLVVPSAIAFCPVLGVTSALIMIGRILQGLLDAGTFFLAQTALCVTGVILFSYITAVQFAAFDIEGRRGEVKEPVKASNE